MNEHILIQIVAILLIGISAQWFAWQMRLPSILLLIIFGFAAGPVSGFIRPDNLFGELLFPLVSFSVAVILYEGGLNLNIRELKKIGRAVNGLISIGALITWALVTAAAVFILNFEFKLAVLFGAILTVTGPTVIMPMLRQIRPNKTIEKILKWEGIVIDPIGAILAVLVFEAVFAGGIEIAAGPVIAAVLKTAFFGTAIGIICGLIFMLVVRSYMIPDFLQNGFSLMLVSVAFMTSNIIQNESGLLAATVMGIFLAGQSHVSTRHLVSFLEEIRVLLISILFIVLAARLPLDVLHYMDIRILIFLAILIIIVRPVSVFISTARSGITFKEKTFLASIAPRGIVAAAVASIFQLQLEEIGYAEPERLTYFIFLTIVGTIAVYGLGTGQVGKLLGISKDRPQGIMFVGAYKWVRDMAKLLNEEGIPTLLVDSVDVNVTQAKLDGLHAVYGDTLRPGIIDSLPLEHIGNMMAMTNDFNVNVMTALRFTKVFGRANVYRLIINKEAEKPDRIIRRKLRARLLFSNRVTFDYIEKAFETGAKIKKTKLTEGFDYEEYLQRHHESAIPLFLIDKKQRLIIFTRTNKRMPKEGETIISLVS